MTRPKAPKVRPTRNPSGMIHNACQRMSVAQRNEHEQDRRGRRSRALLPAQIHSASTTSSSDSGALMIASQVRCTYMRENAEYMPSKLAVNIALWQTMPVPMKAM